MYSDSRLSAGQPLSRPCRMYDLVSLSCAGSEDKQRISTANKARVRMLQCVIMALDRNPVEFAAFLPPFLSLYSTNALTAPDAAGVYALPAKRRVLLTTFLARALVCPHYEPDMIKFIKMKGEQTALEDKACPARPSSSRAGKRL